MKQDRLSICIIAYNEELFLPGLLENIKSQTYPHKYIEVVLVDSVSKDSTKRVMKSFQQEENGFYSVQVIDNPKKIQAAGWNIAIRHATGEVIARIDAHTMLPDNFSEKIMRDIASGEYVVGGVRPCIIEKNTPWSRMLLQAENSMFGSSINLSRRSRKKTYVKTMFHAAYRKEVFEKAGLFNEKLLRTEDNEMHYRIRKSGYRLYYDPEIISYQYARKNLKDMVIQKYSNGFWIGLTLGICPGCISCYHLIPCAFVLGIIGTSVLWMLGFWQLAAAVWGAYGVFVISGMLINIMQNNFTFFTLLMPLVFLIFHVSYGAGTLLGVAHIPARGRCGF